MKKKLIPFVSGIVAALVISCGTVSALAATGTLTISVNPINVLVNGEVFKPKDAAGNDVMIFTYNGTTYAPLRALAETYGLEVGYDAVHNTATVSQPMQPVVVPEAPASDYLKFASVWSVEEKPVTHYGSEKVFTVSYSGTLTKEQFKTWWKSMDEIFIRNCAEQMAAELQQENFGYSVTAYFSYGSYGLGNANAYGDYELSNFDIAKAWIK